MAVGVADGGIGVFVAVGSGVGVFVGSGVSVGGIDVAVALTVGVFVAVGVGSGVDGIVHDVARKREASSKLEWNFTNFKGVNFLFMSLIVEIELID